MRSLVITLLVSACSASGTESGPSDVYVAPTDVMLVHGCVMLSLSTNAAGDCYVRWTCEVGGVRALLCGQTDAGVGCSCLLEDSATMVATTPATCSDPTVTSFASQQCKWVGL